MIGSVVPGIGTLAGAGIGAAIGGIAGLFGKKKPETDPFALPPDATESHLRHQQAIQA
jgi:hypothetical protein